ncbi:M1 family aminopeptidase [Siphonobacter sp.]|uniref:ABC transporter permease/M1 family aminopeptidase n=1 Tax=Siphonobacter sp. TaxID=1869184 RepID=UPI003B3A03F6
MKATFTFELYSYFRKPGFYLSLALALFIGYFIGSQLTFSPSKELTRYGSYALTHLTGLLNLAGMFITAFFSAQVFFQEKDANLETVLYALPLRKVPFLMGQFTVVFLLSALLMLSLSTGVLLSQFTQTEYSSPIQWTYYAQPFFLFSVPNLFLYVALLSGVAWFSSRKLLVYMVALLLYMAYLVVMLYAGSPLMSAALPASQQARYWAALLDPLGLSAFYDQTNHWTIVQKNSQLLQLSGVLLLNRCGYLLFSGLVIGFSLLRYRFQIPTKSRRSPKSLAHSFQGQYHPLTGFAQGITYHYSVLISEVRLSLLWIIRSIPFAVLALSLMFYMAMEYYGTLDQGIRLPERYATTAVFVNRILANFPGLQVGIVLFYSHELFYRSRNEGFSLLERSTPAEQVTQLVAQWLSLSLLHVLMLTLVIGVALVFQWMYQYPTVDWSAYAALYAFIGLPVSISSGLALCLYWLIPQKGLSLLVATVLVLLVSTSLGKFIGLTHPLIRLAAPYSGRYSEMNGWDAYVESFNWRLAYGWSVVLLLLTFTVQRKSPHLRSIPVLVLFLVGSLTLGLTIHAQVPKRSDRLAEQQWYEQQFRRFRDQPKPCVTDVQTQVDLFPEQHRYLVRGTYQLVNQSSQTLDQMLWTIPKGIDLDSLVWVRGQLRKVLPHQTHLMRLEKPLQPGDTAQLHFSFHSGWDGFSGHESFNAIVQNGTFIRLSNYFPQIGYQTALEITSPEERRNRGLGPASPLRPLEAPRSPTDFIRLDMLVSTSASQTVVGVGSLVGQWTQQDRRYFHFQTPTPIPFRFAVSSAQYQLRRVIHRGTGIEVYYDPKHPENVNHLIQRTQRALDYCQREFGPYPFPVIRFAEVSSFTSGFAGTAYPASIFMTEDLLFHANLAGDQQQDVINELAAHELSHQWWGANQLVPDEREGSKLLTETLAMYTELMLVKHTLGHEKALEHVALHRGIYEQERGFTTEEPLYRVKPENDHLHYSKGLVAMYQLSELIGEKRLNQALRRLLAAHAYPNAAPVSTDFLEELYRVSPPATHSKIDALFKQVQR